MSIADSKPVIPLTMRIQTASTGEAEKATEKKDVARFDKPKASSGAKETVGEEKAKSQTVIVNNSEVKDKVTLSSGGKKEASSLDNAKKDEGGVQRTNPNDVQEAAAKAKDPNAGEKSLVKTAVNLNDQVAQNKAKHQEGQSDHYNNDQKNVDMQYRNLAQSGSFGASNVAKRGQRHQDDEEGEQNQRRRKKASFQSSPQNIRKPLTVIEGSKMGMGSSQDMFVSSAFSQQKISNMKVEKSIIEQIKEYHLPEIGLVFYDTVYANYNHNEKNGIGRNMQKDIFALLVEHIPLTKDVYSPQYKRLIRDIIQGAMRAGYDSSLELKDLTKILISGIMAISPHDDDTKIMTDTLKIIVSEIMYGKINIGYNMRDAAAYIGAASYTLSLYYKDFQKEVQFDKSFDKLLREAFADAIWVATGEISNFSTAYAKSNIEHFMTAKSKEEEVISKSVVKNLLLSPFKKVLNRQ